MFWCEHIYVAFSTIYVGYLTLRRKSAYLRRKKISCWGAGWGVQNLSWRELFFHHASSIPSFTGAKHQRCTAAELYTRLGNDTLVKWAQYVSKFGKDMIESKSLLAQAKGFKGEMASHLRAITAALALLLARCRLPEDYEYPLETRTSIGSSAADQPQNLGHVEHCAWFLEQAGESTLPVSQRHPFSGFSSRNAWKLTSLCTFRSKILRHTSQDD